MTWKLSANETCSYMIKTEWTFGFVFVIKSVKLFDLKSFGLKSLQSGLQSLWVGVHISSDVAYLFIILIVKCYQNVHGLLWRKYTEGISINNQHWMIIYLDSSY